MENNITAKVNTNIKAPVSEVWEALTRPEIIKQYLFGTDTITDWKAGSPIIFKGEWEGKAYQDKGTIIAIEKNKILKYDYWSSMSGIEDKPENYMVIRFELSGNGHGTDLELTQENIPDEKTKEHSAENWKKVLGQMKKILEEK